MSKNQTSARERNPTAGRIISLGYVLRLGHEEKNMTKK
jgi:hypothetical protein